MANGKSLLSGILSRDSDRGTSWKNLATSYFSGNDKNNKRRRNAALFSFGVGLIQNKMENKVINNLQESQDKRVFEQAGLTQKWNAYNKLITDDRSFKEDNQFFFKKAETKWGETNPNYDKDTLGAGEAAAKIKNQEIKDLQKKYEEIHNTKLTTGNINSKNYMTKETFFKPFEDFYTEESKRIAAPKNLSVVHNGWDRLTNKFRNESKDKKENEEITFAQANRNSYGYLIEPDAIDGNAAIEVYRKGKVGSNIDTIKMNLDETKINILELNGVTQEQKNYLVRNLTNKDYSKNELQAEIISLSADFNPLKEKRLVAGNNFDEQYKLKLPENTPIPTVGKAGHGDYILRKTNYIDVQTKQGNEEINELRSNVFMLKDLISEGKDNNAEAIRYLENKIRDIGVGQIELMALNTSIQASIDPDIVATFKALANEEGGKPFEEAIAEYQKQTFTGILNFADVIRGNPAMPSKTNNRQGGFSSSNNSN